MPVARALTVAGSDSGGGAGIQADLKTFTALGAYGMSAVTAVTVQNTLGVQGIFPLPPEATAAQIDSIAVDIGVDAAKTGMLATPELIEVVAERISAHRIPALVVDPVMVAKGGQTLVSEAARDALRRRLLPLATLVTPNLPEAEALTGRPVRTWEQMREAARALQAAGARAVVVKGGHLDGPARDLFFDGRHLHELPGERVSTRNTHGTGCTFSAAIAAELAKRAPLEQAVATAKAFIAEAIRRADELQVGHGHGPTNHWAYALATGRFGPEAPRPAGWVQSLRLYAIVDAGTGGRDPVAVAGAALDGGATALQLRDKAAPLPRLVEVGGRLRALCRERGVLFIVNDRPDVALALDADGVHLGQEDLPAALARRLVGPRILGVTVETEAEARAAAAAGADYLGAGPVYATRTKPDAGSPYGPEIVARIAAAGGLPVVGIGGIGPGGAAAVIAAGATGCAVSAAVAGASDPRAAAAALRREIDGALARR